MTKKKNVVNLGGRGRKNPPPKYDDKDKVYAATRNKFIPEAEKYANNLCGPEFPGGNDEERVAWNTRWNTTFIKRMNNLYLESVPCPTCGRTWKI